MRRISKVIFTILPDYLIFFRVILFYSFQSIIVMIITRQFTIISNVVVKKNKKKNLNWFGFQPEKKGLM